MGYLHFKCIVQVIVEGAEVGAIGMEVEDTRSVIRRYVSVTASSLRDTLHQQTISHLHPHRYPFAVPQISESIGGIVVVLSFVYRSINLLESLGVTSTYEPTDR